MADSNSGRLAGRVALITGASRGIGAAVARRFAAEGAKLILAARTVGGLEEVDDQIRQAGGERATLVPLDVTNGAQIDQLGAAIFERFGRLDVLVGNAGVGGTLSPVPHVSPKDWDEVMAVNLTANYRLIRSMDPLLRRSEAGRAIFVTSGLAQRAIAYWGPYAASKAALEMLVRVYAAEVEKTPIRVNLLNPGIARTAARAKAFPGEDPSTVPSPDTKTERFVELAEAACTLNGQCVQA
jgi:NAD(P)-dependent dehydrogenase (short-subunit alcohol dehydrogenase family)